MAINDSIGRLTEEILARDTSKSRTQHVVKAHITSLVSALGGLDRNSNKFPAPYKLGVNALAVLKDLKRWLKFDQQVKKWDVALAVGETGLVANDISYILRDWESSHSSNNNSKSTDENVMMYRDRIASLCLELLVPLTWPLQLVEHESTVNQVNNYNKIKALQLVYKKSLLNFENGIVLKVIVRIAVPIVSLPKHKRSVRDNSILNLCILFFRNIMSIGFEEHEMVIKGKKKPAPSSSGSSIAPEDISSDLVIRVFAKNKVLKLLLTISAGLGHEFDESILGFGCLECLYYLTCGVSPEPAKPASELSSLLMKENQLKTKFASQTGTRHSRFGSLLSFDSAETGRLAVSGQKALLSTENALESLNKSKKWSVAGKKVAPRSESWTSKRTVLGSQASSDLFDFVRDFVDGGFNQFVKIMGKRFHGDDAADLHKIQYCAVLAWVLGFEQHRLTEKSKPVTVPVTGEENAQSVYGLVGSTLYGDNIRSLKSILLGEANNKDVSVCHAVVYTFIELLKLLGLMVRSSLDHDVDVAIATLKRIFTDDAFLTGLVTISREATNKSLDFVVSVIDLLDLSYRILEKMSRDDKLVVVRKAKHNDADDNARQKFKQSVSEFSFHDFFNRFIHEKTVNTYMRIFKSYNGIGDASLKKGLSFFHRICFVYKQYTLLCRMDLLYILHSMSTDKSIQILGEVQDFFKHYMRMLRHQMDQVPILSVEILFPKLHGTEYYLNTGEKEPVKVVRQPNYENTSVVKPIEFKPSLELDLASKFGVLVTTLTTVARTEEYCKYLLQDLADLCETITEDSNLQVKQFVYHVDTMKRDVLRNSAYRLLLSLIGFDLPDVYGAQFGFRADVAADHIVECYRHLARFLANNFVFPEGQTLKDYTRKVANVEDAIDGGVSGYSDGEYKDDNNGDSSSESSDEDDTDFIEKDNDNIDDLDGIQNTLRKRKRSKSSKKHRSKGSKKRKVVEEKKKAKKVAYSSAMYIDSDADASDDEEDDEFFRRERAFREYIDNHGGTINAEQYKEFQREYEEKKKMEGEKKKGEGEKENEEEDDSRKSEDNGEEEEDIDE